MWLGEKSQMDLIIHIDLNQKWDVGNDFFLKFLSEDLIPYAPRRSQN